MTTEERLEVLEKEVKEIRLHSRGTSILLCLSLLFIALGWLRESLHQASKDLQVSSITCQHFSLQDEKGNTRLFMGSADGATVLQFSGNNSNSAAWLRMDKDGNPSLWMHNGDADVSLGLAYQGAVLRLSNFGKDLKASASLSADPDGGVGLSLLSFGKGIGTISSLYNSKNGAAAMTVGNAQGLMRAALGANKGEGPAMSIRDAAGKTKWLTP